MAASVYNPAFYRGGSRFLVNRWVTIVTYQSSVMYRYLFEFYDDSGRLYAYKHGAGQFGSDAEAMQQARALVGAVGLVVSNEQA